MVMISALSTDDDADDKYVWDLPSRSERCNFPKLGDGGWIVFLNAPTTQLCRKMRSHLHGRVLVAIASVLLALLVTPGAILLLLHPPVPALSAPPAHKTINEKSFSDFAFPRLVCLLASICLLNHWRFVDQKTLITME